MEFKNSSEMEDYHYFDPKQLKLSEIPRNRAPFQEAIVFVVGGGNYIEYQNLVDYAKVSISFGSMTRHLTVYHTLLDHYVFELLS